MKIFFSVILIIFAILKYNIVYAVCDLQLLGSNEWCTISQTGISLSSSQTDFIYDKDSNSLYVGFGSHPPTGGYPQISYIQKFNMETLTWSMVRPQTAAPKPG